MRGKLIWIRQRWKTGDVKTILSMTGPTIVIKWPSLLHLVDLYIVYPVLVENFIVSWALTVVNSVWTWTVLRNEKPAFFDAEYLINGLRSNSLVCCILISVFYSTKMLKLVSSQKKSVELALNIGKIRHRYTVWCTS